MKPKRPADWRGEIEYVQPGILSTLPYNKVAQFALGLVVLIVAWRAFTAGWFSAFVFEQTGRAVPDEGMGSPFGLIPFLIDAVCLVGIGGFAAIAMIRGLIGPVFAGLPEWVASFRGEQSAIAAGTTAAVASGIRTTSGRELTVPEALNAMGKRIAAIEAKTNHLETPPEPEPPKSSEELLMEQVQALQAKLDAMDETPGPKITASAARSAKPRVSRSKASG